MKVELGDNCLIIGTGNRAVLDSLQASLDGKKVRGENKITVPIKSAVHLVKFKDVEPINFGEGVKDIVNNVIVNAFDRVKLIEKIKAGEIEYDYDYKGPYPDLMSQQKTMFNAMVNVDAAAILGDPGTGKTLAYLAAIDKRIQKGEVKRALIITLSGLKDNVVAEAREQVPHLDIVAFKNTFHAGKVINKEFVKDKMNIDHHIHVTNYEALKTQAILFEPDYYDMVILDEAHRVGNPRSKQTKAIMKAFEHVKYKYIATGTLNANTVMSFYTPYRFMGPDTVPFANYYSYRQQYMSTVDPDGHIWVPKKGALLTTAKVIGKHALQFKKEDCMDLPDLVFNQLTIPMHVEQKKAYNSAKENMIVELDAFCGGCEFKDTCVVGECTNDKAIIDTALILLRKLHQIAAGFYINSWTDVDDDGKETKQQEIIDLEHNPKLDLLVTTLKNIPEDKKVIIWASYTHSIELIRERLSKEFGSGCVLTLYGNQKAFDQAEKFKDDGYRFFISNVVKGSTGLNMQYSNYMVFYDNTFSLINREQAIGRQHRKGQKNKVTVYDLLTLKTVDEYILETLTGKAKMAMTLSQFSKILK